MPTLRKLSFLLILTLIIHLNGIAQEDVANRDSTANEYDQEETINENTNEDIIDSLKALMGDYASECLRIEFNFEGYESSSEEIYYFDSVAVIKGYRYTWAMEGQSGEEYNWFDNGELYAIYEETQGQQDEPDVTFISNKSDNELKKYQLDMTNKIQFIRNLIVQNQEKISEDDSNITITIEETKFYGFDFTETTTLYLNKMLYEKLFKD
jgi:hypothetical protein